MILNLERFVDKVAVVTGASSGIGRAIADELVKHGVIVAGLARRVERVAEHAEELKDEPGKLYAFKCDMTVEEEIVSTFAEIISKIGDIHILINNAGLSLPTDLINGDASMWKTILDTNVLGLCIATREAIQNMKEKETKGHIIHINSVLGHVVLDVPYLNVYAASKFAVNALAQTLINDLARENLMHIKVTNISPGSVNTEFGPIAGFPQELLATIPALHAQDVAEAVVYALSTSPNVNVNDIIIKAVV